MKDGNRAPLSLSLSLDSLKQSRYSFREFSKEGMLDMGKRDSRGGFNLQK